LGKAAKPVHFTQSTVPSRVSAFRDWSEDLSPADDYFVIVLRPTGATAFGPLREAIERSGFDLGFDLVGQHEVVLDAETGASAP
jgi:hypothetical protein